MKKHCAEALGRFGLVFAGTGAIIINQVTADAITHVGIALTFGLIILAMIYINLPGSRKTRARSSGI